MQNDPGAAEIVGMLVCYGFFILLVLGVQVALCFMLYKAASSLPEAYQQASPGMAFLFLIPLFNIVWAFIYLKQLSQSFQSFFHSMNQPTDDCGEQQGLIVAISWVCTIIPCVNFFAIIVGFIFAILYLMKVWECKARVEQLLAAGLTPHPGATYGGLSSPGNPYGGDPFSP